MANLASKTILVVGFVYSFCAVAIAQSPSANGVNSPASPTPEIEGALEAWEKAYEVFSHPRCANCHVPDDNRPRWSGVSYGYAANSNDWRFHGMNIDAGDSRIGIETTPCNTCHATENSSEPNGPPGAPVWLLAPVEMDWWRKSSSYICLQIKDPDRNGGRDLRAVIDHIAHDELVHWGWNPGPGREPAPHSAQEIADALTVWAEGGAPCPPEADEL